MGPLTVPNRYVATEAVAEPFEVYDYLCDFASACEHAIRRTGVLVYDVRLGGMLVRLRFAGAALVPVVLPAFAHLRTDASGDKPLLTVELWDAASTGVFPPGFPSRGDDVPARGEIREYDDAGVRAVFHSGVRPEDGGFRSVTIFDEQTAIARYFVIGPDHTQWYERAAPLRAVLHWALSGSDRLLVHAGAVGIGGNCLLLTGPGGVGKSSSAVASFLAGLDYLGDDYVLADLTDSHPVVHSLYATAKLAPAASALLPGLQGNIGRFAPNEKKHVIDVSQLRPGGLGTSGRIVGIVLPRLCPDGPTCLRRTSAGAALQALGPSTVFQAPRRDGAALAPLAKLARSVPAYVLELGGAPGEVGPVLSRLLHEEGPSSHLPDGRTAQPGR
jgi:hypothetical protein